MVAHTCSPSIWELRQKNCSEFELEANLSYSSEFQAHFGLECDPISETKIVVCRVRMRPVNNMSDVTVKVQMIVVHIRILFMRHLKPTGNVR